MPITVVVYSGPIKSDGPVWKLSFDAPRIVIGRGRNCDVSLPDPSVSFRHASIRQQGTEVLLG